MIRVRFATGLVLQYSDGECLTRGDHFTDIRDKKDGRLIAQVPNDAVVERVPPCAVYTEQWANATEQVEALRKMLDLALRRNRQLRAEQKTKRGTR